MYYSIFFQSDLYSSLPDPVSMPMQLMLQKIVKSGIYDMESKIRALPGLKLGDFFSGAGSFVKIVDAAILAIQTIFPDEITEALQVGGGCSNFKT